MDSFSLQGLNCSSWNPCQKMLSRDWKEAHHWAHGWVHSLASHMMVPHPQHCQKWFLSGRARINCWVWPQTQHSQILSTRKALSLYCPLMEVGWGVLGWEGIEEEQGGGHSFSLLRIASGKRCLQDLSWKPAGASELQLQKLPEWLCQGKQREWVERDGRGRQESQD